MEAGRKRSVTSFDTLTWFVHDTLSDSHDLVPLISCDIEDEEMLWKEEIWSNGDARKSLRDFSEDTESWLKGKHFTLTRKERGK